MQLLWSRVQSLILYKRDKIFIYKNFMCNMKIDKYIDNALIKNNRN